jgi:molecular chaperone GrpE
MIESEGDQQETAEKIESLRKDLDAEKKRSDEFSTRLKYAQADIENLKKRYERQMGEVKKYCTEPLVLQLLDVVDELELAVKSGRTTDSAEVLLQGVEMTLKKLRKILESEGVYPIDCVGKPFDPAKHQAIAKTEKEGVRECIVEEEIRKGYTMREKVIRPSVVKVVAEPSESQKEMDIDE